MIEQDAQVGETLRTAGELARSAGLADIERRVRALHDGSPTPPRVVCVGMQKVGKSTLVNSLVGRPLLSPVGDDVVTATYVAIAPSAAPGEPEHAVAIVTDADAGHRRVLIELSELADYVSVDAVHEGVIGAEVYLDAPHMRGIEFLDTPGVGGLSKGHNAVTMASLDSAQTLLFAMQPGAPLSLPELQFLAEASRRTASIVLVMTKTDLHPEWQAIREDNLALISRHVPALADTPILPVSSRLAEQAARVGARQDMADRLIASSGLNALVEQIRASVERGTSSSGELRQRHTLVALLGELRARLAERPAYLAKDPAGVATLRAERDRLSAFLHDPNFGALELNRRVQRVRRDAERDFEAKAAALLDRYSGSIESVSSGELRELPTRLKGELAQLIADAIGAVDGEVVDILNGLESRIGSFAVGESLRARLTTEVTSTISEHQQPKDWSQHLVAVAGAAVTASGAWIFAGVLAAGIPMIALGAAAVATVGLRELLQSRTVSQRQGLRSWLDRVRREVDRSFDQTCGQRLAALEDVINSELPRQLQNRVAKLDELARPPARASVMAVGPAPGDVDALLVSIGIDTSPRS